MPQTMEEAFHQLMETVSDSASFQTNVAEMATVVSYDSTRHVADVTLNVDDSGGRDDSGVINECPVLYPCYAVDDLRAEIIKLADGNLKGLEARKTMKVGATVAVVFNNRDLDNFTGSGKFSKSSERMHDINDAIVVGVFET